MEGREGVGMDGKGMGGWVRKGDGGVDFGYLSSPPPRVASSYATGFWRPQSGGRWHGVRSIATVAW